MRSLALITVLAFPFASGCLSIHMAGAEGKNQDIQTLLDKGVPVDKPNLLSVTALMFAAEYGRPDTVRFLLEHGADPHRKDSSGRTALDRTQTFSNPNPEAVSLLKKAMGLPDSSPALAAHGNLDDAAYDRMRASAALPPEKKAIFSDVDAPTRRGLPEHVPERAAAAPAYSAASAPQKIEPSSDIDAPARRGVERPDDFALVIGIEEYQSVPKADFGARDAKTVRRHLEALGFPARNIISLEGSQATGSKLRSYLEEWLPLNVKPTSTLFVYYSGHGAPDTKTGDAYLVPWDGDPKFLKSTALPLKTLYADLAKTKAKRVIVALDACFSGAGGRSVLAQGARPLVAKMAEFTPTEGRITILAAASGDEITGTLQEQNHGLFTYHLLKGLSADPKASAQSLFDYLKPRVQDDARRENREQTPVLAGASLSEPLLAP